jgi:cell wall-associated NlpC family hydrolase
MKKLSLILITALTLSLSGPNWSNASQRIIEKPQASNSFINFIIEFAQRQDAIKKEQERLEQERIELEQANLRQSAMQDRIKQLTKHVGKTWYVFAGSTPKGWDCSGLVLWFYSSFDVQLEHSVSKQMRSGEIVDQPMPGDIISFKHRGSRGGYHNGIYLGDGEFIHSPRPGKKTTVSYLSKYWQKFEIVYTRINIGVLE